MRFSKTILSATLLGCLVPSIAFAQSNPEGWELSVGGGVAVAPLYQGDDEYGVLALPYIRANYDDDRFFASVQDGMGYALIDRDGFRLGPLAQIEFGRKEDSGGPFRISGNDTNDLTGLGDIDTTVSLGGFASYSFGNITASVKGGKALGAHDGVTGDVSLRYKGKITGYGPPLIYSFGPNIGFSDGQYTQAYFGVTDAQSSASGLPTYSAKGGISRYGISGTAILPLSQNLALTTLISYDKLAGDIKDAPLITMRGSDSQFFAGAFIAYKFD